MRTLKVVDAIELATAYAAARYGVRVDGAEFPLLVGERAGRLESHWPARSYAFITAWNPASEPRPDDANQEADAQLVARLEALGIQREPAWAEGPDGKWHEPGWLLADMDVPTASALGDSLGQAAILAWDSGQPVTLRMLAPGPSREAWKQAVSNRELPSDAASCVHWKDQQRDAPPNG